MVDQTKWQLSPSSLSKMYSLHKLSTYLHILVKVQGFPFIESHPCCFILRMKLGSGFWKVTADDLLPPPALPPYEALPDILFNSLNSLVQVWNMLLTVDVLNDSS